MSPPTPASPQRAPLLPLDDALRDLLAHAQPRLPLESVSTFEADGRVLAQDLRSALDVPGHDNRSMDGYAGRVADLGEGRALPVSQRIAAGSSGAALAPASVARIFTGAPVPAGADAVVMQEDCALMARRRHCGQSWSGWRPASALPNCRWLAARVWRCSPRATSW